MPKQIDKTMTEVGDFITNRMDNNVPFKLNPEGVDGAWTLCDGTGTPLLYITRSSYKIATEREMASAIESIEMGMYWAKMLHRGINLIKDKIDDVDSAIYDKLTDALNDVREEIEDL